MRNRIIEVANIGIDYIWAQNGGLSLWLEH